MKTLCILGSPRKNGNSEILVNSLVKGVREAGGTAELVRLSSLEISPCIACGGCEKTGQCVIQDDMQSLYPKVDSVDRIVIASPIYFYGVTAQTKAFIDRCQAMWSRKYLLKTCMKGKDGEARKGYFLSVSATRGDLLFDGAVMTVHYGLDAMDFEYGGELLVRGVDRKGVVAEKQDELERVRSFGRMIIND